MNASLAPGRPHRLRAIPALLIVTAGALVALLVGAAVSLAGSRAAMVLSALFVGPLLLFLPTGMLWKIALLIGLVVAGVAGYFAGLAQTAWVVYGLCLLILAKCLALLVSGDYRKPLWIPGMVWLLVIYLLIAAVSSTVVSSAMQLLTISKNYFIVWAIVFALALARDDGMIRGTWRLVPWVAALQMPFVLYQYFFVSRARQTTGSDTGWDAIVGTFGGDPQGGGQSASMAFFAVLAILVMLRNRSFLQQQRWLIVLLGLAAVLPLIVGEVKAAVLVFLPLGVVLLYRREVVRAPLVFASRTVAVLVAGILVLSVGYDAMHYAATGRTPLSARQHLDKVFAVTTDTDQFRVRTNELGRIALLKFWWVHNTATVDVQTFFGHGMGAVRSSSMFIGSITRRHPYNLNSNAASLLLWEVGVFGFAAFLAVLSSAAWKSFALSRSILVPQWHRVALELGGIALLMTIIAVFYKRFPVDSWHMQLLIAFFVGQTVYWYGIVRRASGPKLRLPTPSPRPLSATSAIVSKQAKSARQSS
jgi:hypothetical protein